MPNLVLSITYAKFWHLMKVSPFDYQNVILVISKYLISHLV